MKLSLFAALLSLAIAGESQAQTWKMQTSKGDVITVTADPPVQIQSQRPMLVLPPTIPQPMPMSVLQSTSSSLPVYRSIYATPVKFAVVKPDPLVVKRTALFATWFANRPRLVPIAP